MGQIMKRCHPPTGKMKGTKAWSEFAEHQERMTHTSWENKKNQAFVSLCEVRRRDCILARRIKGTRGWSGLSKLVRQCHTPPGRVKGIKYGEHLLSRLQEYVTHWLEQNIGRVRTCISPHKNITHTT